DVSFQATLSVNAVAGQFVTATATDPGNNTSEFARAVPVKSVFVPPPVGAAITATEGTAFTTQVATFSVNDTSLTSSNFTAMINWGDGTTPTAGVISGS